MAVDGARRRRERRLEPAAGEEDGEGSGSPSDEGRIDELFEKKMKETKIHPFLFVSLILLDIFRSKFCLLLSYFLVCSVFQGKFVPTIPKL